jgi:hypothetical protein
LARASKYTSENLLPLLRKSAAFREELLVAGFTDNGGAIHSSERILDILSQRIKYPSLRHSNAYKYGSFALFSVAALKDYRNGKPVYLEHVAPIREYAREVISRIGRGDTDQQIVNYIKRTYLLVMLSKDETARLNKLNRSKLTRNRLLSAGIKKLVLAEKTVK